MRPRGTSVNWQVSAGDEQAMRQGRDDQHISLLLRLFQYLGWSMSMSSHCMPPLASMAEVMSFGRGSCDADWLAHQITHS